AGTYAGVAERLDHLAALGVTALQLMPLADFPGRRGWGYDGALLFASATAITHLGIGTEMVLVAFGITFGGLIFALALAFGLGGRALARQILERHVRSREPHPRETLTHL
ncbi:MAG TPA: hypothetical protein VIF59_14515, partial [Methylomirabilota bacterium]